MLFKNKYEIDTRLALILSSYLILGFVLLGYYKYQINPDGIIYIRTALKYLSGDFSSAVNAYWGPLLSWLLIPFLYLNQTPVYALFAVKILSIIVGFFTLIGFRQLSYRFEMDEVVRTVLLLIMVPVILYFSLSTITPDLLIVCIMVYYLYLIFSPDYPNKVIYAFLCGVLGAVAFMGKSFMFPFFIVHFLIMNLLHYLYRKDLKIKITQNLIIGFIAFLLLSGVWIGMISSKEGKLTFGTSGELNHAIKGPDGPYSIGFQQFYQGLSAPGEKNNQKALNRWSPFESWSNFKFQLNMIWNNIIDTLDIYQSFSFLSIIIIICSLMILIPAINRFISGKDLKTVLFSLVTILIYSGGYWPVLVEGRYLWPVDILLILLGGFLISLLFDIKKSDYMNLLKILVLFIFTVSFIYMPITSLYTNLNTGKDIHDLSNTLKTQYGVEGNIASDDNRSDSMYLSFYLNTIYFGRSKKDISSAELQSELDKYKINYYLVWGKNTPYLIGYTEITNGKLKNLRIYKRD